MEKIKLVKKIFIVDDDKFLLDMYSTKFREKGFEVVQFLGSTDVIDGLTAGGLPDLILLDIVMPNIDGFELLKKIKDEKLAPGARVLMFSSLGEASDIEESRALGANGYVIKAMTTPSEVVERVMTILEGGEAWAEPY